MTALEKQLYSELSKTVTDQGMLIDELHYRRRGKDNVLEVYVEREDLSAIDLDEIVDLSEKLSERLDELDLISDNYCLDVSTSGAEKPIRDFKKFPSLIGKYMEIRLIHPLQGQNVFVGTLEEADEEKILLSYRVKARTLKAEIDIANIGKAKLTVKL